MLDLIKQENGVIYNNIGQLILLKNDDKRISLGELGSYDCVTKEEIDEVFDKVDGIVFKMKKCMFRISYVHKGQRKFTAELINEEKKSVTAPVETPKLEIVKND
jgi:hypothetical protein